MGKNESKNEHLLGQQLDELRKKCNGLTKKEALIIVDKAIDEMEKELKELQTKLSIYNN